MKVRELLATRSRGGVEGVTPKTTLKAVANKLIDLRIGALVVCDADGHLQGIVSERDLIAVVAESGGLSVETSVEQIMTRSVVTCNLDDEVAGILEVMTANAIRHVPVLEDGELAHMLSIRELTCAYEMLRKEAYVDPLTQLSNRRPFLKALEKEFARANRYRHPMSVAMLDVDHFKSVNDKYGHDAGDQVLRTISTILQSEFRTIEYVGRLGGEEFAVIFPETSTNGAHSACVRILDKIQSTSTPVQGGKIGVTASIGIAEVTTSARDGATVLKWADERLYEAKRSGRNCIVFANPATPANVVRRNSIAGSEPGTQVL
ncbi:MAG: diguanylate cyclase [Pseudomonadota bacterium]